MWYYPPGVTQEVAMACGMKKGGKGGKKGGPAGQRTDRGLAGSNVLTDFADELAARVPHHPENAG